MVSIKYSHSVNELFTVWISKTSLTKARESKRSYDLLLWLNNLEKSIVLPKNSMLKSLGIIYSCFIAKLINLRLSCRLLSCKSVYRLTIRCAFRDGERAPRDLRSRDCSPSRVAPKVGVLINTLRVMG